MSFEGERLTAELSRIVRILNVQGFSRSELTFEFGLTALWWRIERCGRLRVAIQNSRSSVLHDLPTPGRRVVPPGSADLDILRPIRSAIEARAGGTEGLSKRFPQLVRAAIDFVIDPVRTARTTVAELDNVEKTFLGLKVEHFIRDFLDVPKGVRDLDLGGVDVDVKNTTAEKWMIPKETYSEDGLCLLSRIDDVGSRCSLGLIVARLEYLGAPNRDGKRSPTVSGKANILWLLEDVPFSESDWSGLNMARFRELRSLVGGSRRAALFFEEHLDRWIGRQVIESLLYDQRDFMKRLRGNGGARDLLRPKGINLMVDSDGNCCASRTA